VELESNWLGLGYFARQNIITDRAFCLPPTLSEKEGELRVLSTTQHLILPQGTGGTDCDFPQSKSHHSTCLSNPCRRWSEQ
jgi:hypothetical protein